jgi:cytochrome oxidase assembly protein ShyY1
MSGDQIIGVVLVLGLFTIAMAMLIGQWQAQHEDAKKTTK